MRVSTAYYVHGRSRVEIADELGISRFKVARALEEAREMGIVSITVHSGAPMPELSAQLAGHLRLRRASVVEVYGDAPSVRAAVGREAGALLRQQLEDGEVLGIGWGRTLNTMFDDIDYLPQVEIVQLSGRFGGDVENSAAQLTRRTATLAGASAARVIRAPFFIDDARQANAARRHPTIAAVVADFARITTAVVGIGAVAPVPMSVAVASVPPRVAERLLSSGAVGEIQGSLFAADGHIVSGNLWRHTMSITPATLARVPRVIAAAAGVGKAHAAHAVCASGVPTDLVVDVELANALLAMPPIGEVFHQERMWGASIDHPATRHDGRPDPDILGGEY
jgi:DNA-binding transcriptional regulator LsrR (DeoR family)